MLKKDKIVAVVLVGAFIVGVQWYTTRPNPVLDPAPQDNGKLAVAETIEFVSALDKIHPDKIKVIGVEDAEWPDSCLGLARADEMCSQALVPGFKITLDADGETMIFRTDKTGSSIRRELIN